MTRTLAVLLLVVSACGSAPCGPSTCASGCCDASGKCVEVPRASACGVSGAACVACAGGQVCVDGACAPSGVGGGTGGGAGGGAGGGSGSWQDELVAAHNQVRANASPAPNPPLPPLTWNAQAAATAQAWANNCRFAHNQAIVGTYGENLFASTGSATPTQVTNDWASERASYNYANNTCSAMCGHYTQIVWRSTTSVGCASAQCTANNPFGGTGPWFFWVCDYAPPGNFVRMKPY